MSHHNAVLTPRGRLRLVAAGAGFLQGFGWVSGGLPDIRELWSASGTRWGGLRRPDGVQTATLRLTGRRYRGEGSDGALAVNARCRAGRPARTTVKSLYIDVVQTARPTSWGAPKDSPTSRVSAPIKELKKCPENAPRQWSSRSRREIR
jgi:hypothetical protein